MELVFSFVQLVSIILLKSVIIIDGNVIEITPREYNPVEQVKVPLRHMESMFEPKSFELKVPTSYKQHNSFDGIFIAPFGNIVTGGRSNSQPLEHPYSGERIRLRSQGKSAHSGLVEVYRAGQWGYVCDDGWDLSDASVACYELGFTLGAASAKSRHSTRLQNQKEQKDSTILMDNVQCLGTENSLDECPHSVLNDCSLDELAGVECQTDTRCPKNWISGLGKCYKFYTKAKTIKQASSICLSDNASLLTIDSIKENHFLSYIIKHSVHYIHKWYTGGWKHEHVWHWRQLMAKSVADNEDTNSQDHYDYMYTNVHLNAHNSNWFPGWPSFNNEQAEPINKKKHNCLTLSDEFKHPISDSLVVVDSFYWKADSCKAPGGINFICQMSANYGSNSSKEDDCYTGDGSSYRGTAAVTEEGGSCLQWSMSPDINEKTHPEKGLGDHNFCRNPNGEDKPWCWVSYEAATIGTCKLPKCSQTNAKKDILKEFPVRLDIQLVGGRHKSEGNVEVVIDNLRYRVCDENWDDTEASVVCRMLGYRSGGIATKSSLFGNDLVSVILDDVDCNGTETDLNQCSIIVGGEQHDCSSEEYAGAICTKNPEPHANVLSEQIYTGKCGQLPFSYQKLATPQKEKSSHLVYNLTGNVKRLQEGKIIGGNFAQHGEYPWQVRIQLVFNVPSNDVSSYGMHHCGAAVINAIWLLSAAHCFHGKRKEEFAVYVGDHNQKVKDFGEQTFSIDEIILHEKYDDDTKDYDIALIKIKPNPNGETIQFNYYVQPVCLPDSKTPYTRGTNCSVSGWGYVKPREPDENRAVSRDYPSILKSVDVPLLNSEVCEKMYSKHIPSYNSERMLCAGYFKGGSDSCDGDSGGPLICKIADVYTVMGVTSWGIGCAMPNLPGVYTRVATFASWINEKINAHSKTEIEKTLPKKL